MPVGMRPITCGLEQLGDIVDPVLVARALADCEPEIIIHMAAQALVLPSYLHPLRTYATNVRGTANLLQAVRSTPSVRAASCEKRAGATPDLNKKSEWLSPYKVRSAKSGHSKSFSEIALTG